tara:strand:+ start:70 stop:804 length:735 start_codon:yes stop_codon:yes gene_type:complete
LFRIRGVREGLDGPEALINGAKVKVDLDFVVLKGNKRESKARVAAEPELKGHVKGRFREGVARSAHLARSVGVARTIHVSVRRIRDEGQLGGVANHLVVARLLVLVHGELAPDVHPVAVLLLNALASDLNFHVLNELVAREIEPASVHFTIVSVKSGANFRKSDLKVGAISKITVAGDRACYPAAEIGLTVESLLNGFHGEVRVATVSHLPESDLWVARKIDILGAVSDELHETSSHCWLFIIY